MEERKKERKKEWKKEWKKERKKERKRKKERMKERKKEKKERKTDREKDENTYIQSKTKVWNEYGKGWWYNKKIFKEKIKKDRASLENL